MSTSRTACRQRNEAAAGEAPRTSPAAARKGWRSLPWLGVTAGIAVLYAQTSRSVWDGVYTEAQARRGAQVYARECASCHGLALNGGESAPPLMGGEFLSNWNGLTVGDLFERIRTSMPADAPGRLKRAENADVIAHILSVNQFPTGGAELDARVEYLKQIRVESSHSEVAK